MVVFVTILQAAEDRNGILGARFVDHDLLETAFEGLVLLEILLELVERRGADRPQLTPRKGGLEDVGGVHRTRRLAGAHEGVDFVDEQQDVAVAGHNFLHNGFQAFLEFALILGTRDQGTHVERVDHLRFEVLGHVAVDDPVCDTLGDGGLADTRLSHEDRVVLGTPREDLQHAADLLVTADHRIEFARTGLFVEVDGILAQRIDLLLGGLRIDRSPFAEGADRLKELLLGGAAALEDVGGLSALGDEPQQQVFDRRVFVAEVPGKVHGALDHLRGVLRKELVAAAFDPRQGRDGPAGLVAQAADIHPDTPQEERGERIVLADKHAQNMERLDSLLSALPGKRQCTLQSLLRFYS